MTTLITGATGFLGSAVVRLLLAEGQQLRALVRAGSDTKNIDGLDIERVTGDLTDMASLKAAAKGCDALYHVAADYRLWIPKPKEIYD
ncbi:MAG: NAD(P)H-binding protein, partial [Rhodospirillaceae bacterium]|nr:NAD(P)H-binding protein [Rhodospirillaceae bacterium]